MLCRYREVVATAHWEVLARGESRCGAPAEIGTVVARAGEPVAVPEAPSGTIVIARVTGMEGGPGDRLRALALRPQDWYARLDDRSSVRLVIDTARNGLLLGVPAGSDFSGPFAYGPAVRTITIAPSPSMRASATTLTYVFVAIPMHAP